ncbi:hypothetical protein [Methanoregula sp.]|jgi:hypothetical protein|uniref:hypothetical protein n=1 Tax=Methanoregula sp. TaxID=2052170 RepID=UPI0025FBD71C|nr:hypothetical protein [Methanoregula sp.]
MIRLTAKLTTKPINQCGLVAGALGGESIVLLVLVNTLLLKAFAQENLPISDPKVIVWNTIYPFLIIVIFEGWGVFAAWLGTSELKNRTDALLTGFISGIMIGILLEVMWIAQIFSMIAHQLNQYSSLSAGYGNTLLTIGILIIFAILGGILSGFGSYIFYLFKLQSKDRASPQIA